MPTKHKKSSFIAYALIIVGVAGLLLAWKIYIDQPKPPSLPTGVKAVNVVPAPSSVKHNAATIASYKVAPELPKYITLPTIGVSKSRVIQLSLMSNGQIATPDNIYDAGWYNGSAKPGQLGAMFIYGHVSSWTADGIFYNLKKLKISDDIVITRGDNQIYNYQVVAIKVYPYNHVDMKTVLSPVNPNKPGLNLMTCTGKVIKATNGTNEFNERLVVFTTLVSG